MDEQHPPMPTNPAPVLGTTATPDHAQRANGSSSTLMTDEQSRGTSTGSPSTIMSAEDSRKMILNSYEAAGVDLPLTQLETVLDKEISPNDFGANKGPRFRKFLDKASSAMINNQARKADADVPDDELISDSVDEDDDGNDDNNNDNEETFDNEFSNKSTGNDNNSNADAPATTATTVGTNTAPQSSQEEGGHIPVSTAATAAVNTSADGTTGMPFEFCCPESSPCPMTNDDDKYVISNLQLPPAEDSFDDEYQNSRRVALMDVEDSMIDTTLTMEKSPLSGGQFSKGGGKHGMFTHFRGSRRFRMALFFCCALHLILIGLIITFVMTMDNEEAAITQDQAAAAAISSSSSSINTVDMISSTDLVQKPQLDVDSAGTTTSVVVTEEVQTTSSNKAVVSTEISSAESESEESECVDRLELSLDCFGRGSEVLVYFNVCTPQPGDWVAMYDISHDPENLLDDDSVSWLYTCGDRRCTETVQTEVLSFSRVTDVARAGTYRAYLIRNGEGSSFSSFASSPDFHIVDNPNTECPV